MSSLETDGHVELERMTTGEAERAFKDATVALIPVGSTEQHGTNMTLATDTRLAHAVSVTLANRMRPHLVVAPPIPVGISYHHLGFAGSLTLRPSTLQAVVSDYITSLKGHGIRSFIFMNGHGGNQAALSVMNTVARYELGVRAANVFYWNLAKTEIAARIETQRYGHACEMEASFGLYLAEDTVRQNQLTPARLRDYPLRHTAFESAERVDVPYAWEELTEDGSFGDARKASFELGKEITDLILERLEEFVEDFIGHAHDA